MDYIQYQILKQNYDDDIDPSQDCAIEANNFSLKAIPLIIKDDIDGFIGLVSSPEFNWDGSFPHARDRMYLSDYLYQPFFDELTGPNALCFAAFFNAEKIVEFILSLPDVNKADAFHYACAGGSFNVMRTLFDQSECDLINKDSVRPLNIASYFGNVDVVKYLYSHGCHIINQDDTYSSVNKAAFNGNINVLEFFRSVDPNLLKKTKDYKHPIISAAIGGQPECIKYFINLGDLNKSTILSALKEACSKGSLACVKILVEEYKNFKPQPKNNEKKSLRRKISKDDEFLPSKQKERKKKTIKKEEEDYDEENCSDSEDESDEEKLEKKLERSDNLPLSLYITAVKKRHVDVLHYLCSVNKVESVDELLLCAIDQIDFAKITNIINPRSFFSSYRRLRSKEEEKIIAQWTQQSSSAVQIAKFILSSSNSKNSLDILFEMTLKGAQIDNILFFLDEISFKIIDPSKLTESQIDFFKYAILNANSMTIPLINRILNNADIDFFESESYERLLTKNDNKDQKTQQKKKYKENDEEYREDLRLMNNFQEYLTIISKKSYAFKVDSAMFLIEKKFPYYIIVEKKVKNINNFSFLMFPFFDASIKMGRYEYAKSFLSRVPTPQLNQSLEVLFEEANKQFNKDENKEEKKEDFQDNIQPNYFNGNRSLIYIKNFNSKISNTKDDENEHKNDKFNIFDYKCQNEEEMKVYQQIMSMIKTIIKMASTEPQVAIQLCTNGLNKEWIIEQMKENNEDEIIIHNEDANSSSSSIYMYGFMSRVMPPKNYEHKSLNPLINLATTDISNSFFGLQIMESISELVKYYMNYGIDVSRGTEYSEMLWKYIIDNKKGFYANILVQYGNADKDERLLDDSISLIDYAIEKKAVNVIYIFFKNHFYSQNSHVIQNPIKTIEVIAKEKIKKTSKSYPQGNPKKDNLKIIFLIYKFVECNYDQKKKDKLISELKNYLPR